MDKERLYHWTLEQKETESIRIIRETLDCFGTDKVATTFTGGKGSLTLLHLVRRFYDGPIPVAYF